MNTLAYDGIENGGLSEDVIEAEILAMSSQEEQDAVALHKKLNSPPLTKNFLIFVFQTWDKNSKAVKQCVARYSVGAGISGEFLAEKYEEIICALYSYGFIVNNIAADGATENRNAFKQLGTIIAKNEFLPLAGKTSVPNPKLPVAFLHPCNRSIKIFIGGEMPRLIKKIENAFDRSSKDGSKTLLKFRGEDMSLKMIKKAWLAVDNVGFGSLHLAKCTDDHFNQNRYNAMQVYLAAQVFSSSVCNMINVYLDSFETEAERE